MDNVDREPAIEATRVGPTAERRRFARFGDSSPVPTLVDQSVRSAELQLLDAREALKGARRRVVQLEEALDGWKLLREQIVHAGVDAPRAAAG